MSSNASRCPWCGHRGGVAFLAGQLILVFVLFFGAAVVAGVLPAPSFARFFRLDLPSTDITPPAIGAASAGGGASSGGGGGRTATAPAPTRPRQEREPRQSATECADSGRMAALAQRYGNWSRQTLAAVACGRVERGFTVDQVREAIGSPVEVRAIDGGEEWVLGDGRRIVVRNGVVTSTR